MDSHSAPKAREEIRAGKSGRPNLAGVAVVDAQGE